MLSACHIDCGYSHSPILLDLSFSLKKGEFIILLGKNGSGKTTLLKTLSALLPPLKGTVFLNGENMATLSPRRIARSIAVVPQRTDIRSRIRVRDLVLLGRFSHLSPLGLYQKHDFEVAEWALAQTETQSYAERFFHELSGGEAQRVLLAMALAQESDILLLDEIAAHVDLKGTYELFDLLWNLRSQGKCIFAIAHDYTLAHLFATRVMGIKSKHILFDGSPKDVVTSETLQALYDIPLKSIAISSHLSLAYPARLLDAYPSKQPCQGGGDPHHSPL